MGEAAPAALTGRRAFLHSDATRWAVAAGVTVVILLPVLTRAGWPYNHNALMDFSRMYAVVGQWRLGHLIPVWSTVEQWGYGSPAPALYNKAFLYVSAAFLLVTGEPKAAVALGLAIFMMVAFAGAAAAVRAVLRRANSVAEWTAGALVVSCNYATTDWFVRGAFAEFAALAVATWIFAWCLTLMVQGRWALWLGPAMGALALSHVVIGLFCLVPLALAVLIALLTWRGAALAWIRPAIVSAAIFLVLVLPFEIPLLILSRWANVHALAMFTPAGTHLAAGRLFWDTEWHWGERWDGFTIQLDLALLAGLVAFALLAMGRRWVIARSAGVAVFLAVIVALMLILQTRPAAWAYASVPGASLIQFSWRLLTFTSIAVAIGCGLLVGWIGARWPSRAGFAVSVCAGVLLLASTLPNKPWWSGVHYKWFGADELAHSPGGDVAAGGEYLPRVTATAGVAPTVANSLWRPWGTGPAGACSVTPGTDLATEQAALQFRATCSAAAQAVLPVFDAPGMTVRIGGAPGDAVLATTRTCADALMRVDLPAGQSVLTLRTPSWMSVLAAGWNGSGFHYDRACR
jgi:hypothetical protein